MRNDLNNITSLSIDVTYNCNLHCKHCFNSSGEKSYHKSFLDDNQLLDIISQVAELPALESVCFCGGEPFLRKEILYKGADILKKNNNDLSVNTVTNGMLLSDDVIDEINSSNLNLIQVSLDGFTPEQHNFIRNNHNSYAKALNAIKKLCKTKKKVGVATLPTKINYDDIPKLVNLLNSLGVYIFRMQPLMILGRAKDNLGEYVLSPEEYRLLARYLLSANMDEKIKMRVEWGDPIQHMLSCQNQKSTNITINAYGEILVTPYLTIIVGDLKKHSLKEYIEEGLGDVWYSDFLQQKIHTIKSWDTMDISLDGISPAIFSPESYNFDICKNKDYFKKGMKYE